MTALPPEKITKEAAEVGLTCQWLDKKRCVQTVQRIHQNARLAEALNYAKEKGVRVYPKDSFDIGNNWVNVDVNAKDEEIIKFLME